MRGGKLGDPIVYVPDFTRINLHPLISILAGSSAVCDSAVKSFGSKNRTAKNIMQESEEGSLIILATSTDNLHLENSAIILTPNFKNSLQKI